MNKFIVGLGLILGNFVYQYISGDYNYSVAVERSYFQALAMLVTCYFPLKGSK